jgi:DNA-binding transcriptional MerR regulator
MTKDGLYPIGEFAMRARTTKDTLLHYDRIGLMKPKLRTKKGFRLYSPTQLPMISAIRTFQDLGMSLGEIKELFYRRDSESLYNTFYAQRQKIDEKIHELLQSRDLLTAIHENIVEGMKVDMERLYIERVDSEPIILGELNDYSNGKDDYDALNAFYDGINEKYPQFNLNYPVWGYFSKDRVVSGDWKWPDRYYIYHPNGEQERPGGMYAVGYMRCGYGECGDLYVRLLDFIETEGYEVSGGSYEEYLLNEVSLPDDGKFLMRLRIQVSKKGDKLGINCAPHGCPCEFQNTSYRTGRTPLDVSGSRSYL